MPAGGAGDGSGAGLGREVLGGGEARAVVAEFGEELGGIDLTGAGEALEERAVGVVSQGRGDGGRDLLDPSGER